MEKENIFEHASDHVIWEYLKLQDAEAWKLVWERAVLAEVESYRSATKVRDWGVPAEELMSLLYVEMVGGGKLALYRDDGGSLWGWMRTYVRGYILRAQPDSRLSSLERAGETAGAGSRKKFRWACQIGAGGTPCPPKTLRCGVGNNGSSCRSALPISTGRTRCGRTSIG